MRNVALLALAAASCSAGSLVTGTGNPNLDVPAVQAAVDRGGQVILRAHFSFDRPTAKPPGAIYERMVTLAKGVVISGERDEHGDMPAIEGGSFAFFVDVPGARVEIREVRFVRPKGAAIWVYAASGLVIKGCKFDGVEPAAALSQSAGVSHGVGFAVFVGSNPVPPKPGQQEQEENNTGTLSILDNDIDVGGSAGDQTLGIAVFGVGRSPDKEVDLYISGNNIKNITARAINVRQIDGRVHIERNVITTGPISGPSNGVLPDVIHAVGSGSYLIEHNAIVSEWAAGAGIRVQGSAWSPEANAIVADNDVTMSAPEGTFFGGNSAAIEIRGFAQGNRVVNNRIRGRARAALAVAGQDGRSPENNTFASNDLAGFQPGLAGHGRMTGVQ
jgi:hypothetical protein